MLLFRAGAQGVEGGSSSEGRSHLCDHQRRERDTPDTPVGDGGQKFGQKSEGWSATVKHTGPVAEGMGGVGWRKK